MNMNIRRRKMMSILSFDKQYGKIVLLLSCIFILQVVSLQFKQVSASFYGPNDDLAYDPELNSVGLMTEMSNQRRISPAPAIKWNYDDHQDEDTHNVLPAKPVERRSDIDNEDDEEEDRDEDKSGSSNHGSYTESPSYGESPRAAQDGEDIESFFDTHLGPQDAADNPQADTDATPSSSTEDSQRYDPDDQYETAASTPLSDIFHTIIRAHRRPIVITTSDESTTANNNPSANTAVSTLTQNPAEASQSASSLVGASSSPLAGIPFVRGSPFLDVPQMPAYYSPVAAPSSYEPQGVQEDASQSQDEIYIARRPLLPLARFRDYGIPLTQKLIQQSSNVNWRGYARPYEQQPYYQNRYPVAASYVYQREQPRQQASQLMQSHQQQEQQIQQEPPEDEQTVSYGLSFGGSPLPLIGGSDADSSSDSSMAGSGEKSIDEPVATYNSNPLVGHSSYKPLARPNPSATRSYNNYNYPPPLMGPAQLPAASYIPHDSPVPKMVPREQSVYQVGSRPHKDGGQTQPINYNQYSGSNSMAPSSKEESRWATTRQQLIAKLDKQIKSNPYYQQNAASSAPESQYIQKAQHDDLNLRYEVPRHSKTSSVEKQPSESTGVDSDVDTYSSFHSEIDPYKSYTSSTELINEPQPENSVLKNSHQDPGLTNTNGGTRSTSSFDSQNNNQTFNSDHRKLDQPSTNTVNGSLNPSNIFTRLNSNQSTANTNNQTIYGKSEIKHRVRREDPDDRENDDAEDDGVWVDDDEDDDNRQTASDLNETTEQPGEEEEENNLSVNEPVNNQVYHTHGMVDTPHGYEISHL